MAVFVVTPAGVRGTKFTWAGVDVCSIPYIRNRLFPLRRLRTGEIAQGVQPTRILGEAADRSQQMPQGATERKMTGKARATARV